MAHSCRWRFPARPGGSSNLGTGRRAGRIRVSASLRSGTSTHPNTLGLRPGFDAALQVSSAIGCNLQTFRDVLGESSGSSSGEEGTFGGFGTVSEHRRIRSPSRTLAVTPTQEKKPRGRPPRAQTAQKGAAGAGPSPSSASGKPEGQERPAEKAKRLPGRPPGSGEKRRGRPPASGTQRSWQARSHAANDNDSRQAGQEHGSTAAHRKDRAEDKKERKATKRTPLGSVQQQHDTEAKPPKASRESKVTKLKRLREVKLSPLKSRLKAIARKCVPVPGVPRRRRGRPPSAERLKAEAAAAAQASGSDETKPKALRVRRDGDTDPHTPQQQSKLRVSHVAEEDDSPDVHSSSPPSSPLASSSPSKLGRPLNLRTSPRHIKPVRIVPPSKRTDAAIAKQLLQRAKKGAQKKKLLEKEAVAIGGQGGAGMETGIRRRRRTQLKNIRQFIMPVVSTVSLRIIKTPKRFIEDEGSFGAPHPHMKMARFDAVPPPVAAPQPASASSPIRPSTAAVTTAAATAVTAAPVDTLPPPAAVTTSSATAVGASLLNNRCNNSTSNGRFSSSAASCGSSAMSQHSSQSSRSSSPSLDDSSCDSQASEGTQALSEPEDEHDDERDHSQGEREGDLLHTSRPPSEPEQEQRVLIERGRRGRRGQGVGRGSLGARGRGSLATGGKKAIISPATGVLMSNSQQAASTASSSSSSPPPPPLLSPPQQAQSGSNTVEHHPHSPWILPHPFLQGPSLVLSSLQDKRRSILREPTFRWTSRSRTEQQYFSSAKYAKEGLIRKPIFDNFRPPPLTAQDVGLMPHGAGGVAPAGYPTPGSGGGSGAGTRLFSPLHHHHQQHPSSRFESTLQKRSPLLRAPRFTPSEAHSRIFESVTLQSSSGSSPGSLSPLQSSPKSGRSVRRRRRKTLGPLRGQPRSPSHSMTTRSSQPGAPPGKGPSELCVLTGSVSTGAISTSNSSSSLPTSALTPAHFSTFSPGPLGLSTQGPSSSCDGHRAAGSLGGGAGGNSSSSQLFPLFTSSPQETGRGAGKGGRERSASASRDSAPVREMERETEKSREREKENKREGRKDWERRGKASTPDASPNTTPSLFAVEGRDGEEALTSLAPKKTPGRKKSASVDSGTETAPVDRAVVHSIPLILTKGRLSKKTRPSERGPEAEPGEKEKKSAPAQQTGLPPGQTGSKKPLAAPSLGSMLAHAEKLPVADKRVAGLLKKAKAQLFKIEKSKSLKSPDHPKVQSQESDSSETSVRGPRIKHVCRRAAVALGRNRAVFPDDMPTLSALPWEEREKILSSMGNDDKSSVAGSEEAEPQSPPIKPVMRHTKTIQEGGAAPRKGRRSRRCGQCPGCQVPEDCGVCTNCLDKPKFGGRNIKKQCCKVRKCQNLQWMPSKIFLQKQVKGKKDKKKNKLSEKKEAVPPVKDPTSTEPSLKPTPPPLKEEPPRKKSETPPPKSGEEKQKQPPPLLPPLQSPPADNPTAQNDQPPKTPSGATAPGHDQKHPETVPTGAASKKERKPQQPTPPSSPSSSSSSSLQSSPSPPTPLQPPQQQRPQPTQGPAKKEGGAPKSPPTEAKRKPQQQCLATPITDTAPEGKLMRKPTPRSVPPPPKPTKPKEKQQKPLATKPESSTLNLLSTPSTGGTAKQKVPSDGVHRIRVDFKKDHDVENVWATGGLSLLTSVPITPRVVCFLCASSGNVEFVFCQVCCEPFHLFCLGETERPLEEQWENWCCRRCRFCHTCGRQHQKTKQLLECEKCRNSYHPECLGPNHPTRPTKKKRVWICTKCVRCKSCGATKAGKAWDAQWSHDFSLCHDCAKLFAKGNFCPLCDKCYDEDDYESKMMQCGRCDHWVHSKCENLTDEMYELLSKLPESVAYTCTNCTKRQPAEWRTALEKELQGLVRQVLTALLNSRTSTHLLRYRQAVMKPPELNPETEESLPSRRSPEGPDPPVLTEVTPPNDSPLDLESVEKKLAAGRYKSVLEFSDDIVKIIQTAINSDGGQPENRKANSMVKSFFIRQMERVFPWFKVKESRFWETHKFSNNSGLLPNAVLPPSLDHNYAQWQEREEIARAEQPLRKKIIPAPCPKTPGEPDFPTSPPPPRPLLPPPPPMLHDLSREDSPELLPPPGISDNRQCALCLKYGDDNINEGGRLLYIGQNEWTHVNCALWSAEVFEDDDGSLKNVHMAVIRGKQLRCENCQRPGATVGCCLTSCTRNYHFMCARQRHCVFLEDKKVYCQRHRDLIKGEVVSESGFEVTRRILVDLEGISLRRKFLTGLQPENIHMMIGSMTIDCLGILTELSDCERKLFPIGYQCSRVYWSTLDARKRCVYTCRILVCRPTLVEPDLKSALPEENRTISHSHFTPISDKVLSPVPGPFDSLKPSDRLSLLPSSPNPPKVYTRNRHPSYPPCQRSPGSRPLPSPGGSSQLAHEIVTVGDPLLSSGLRSIGSRRHSTSSLSPQPRQMLVSPPLATMNQLALLSSSAPPPPLSSASRDLGLRDTEKGKPPASGVRTQSHETSSLSPGGAHSRHHHSISEMKTDVGKESAPGKQAVGENPKLSPTAPEMAGASQASPPPGTGVLTGHQRASSSSSSQVEKGKQGGKDPDLSAGVMLLSRHRVTTTLSKDKGGSSSNPAKEGSVTLAPASKDAGKLGSPQPPFHKSGGRKSQDYLSGPAPAADMKPLWSSEATAEEDVIKQRSQATPAVSSSHAVPTTKDKHSKVRNIDSRETCKEREKTPQNSNKNPNNAKETGGTTNTPTPTSQNSKAATLGNNTKTIGKQEVEKLENQGRGRSSKSRERFSSPEKNSSSLEAIKQPRLASERGMRASQVQARVTANEVAAARDKKRAIVKASLTPLKTDPNGTNTVSTSSDSCITPSICPAGQEGPPHRRSSCSMLFSPSARSESSESNSPPPHPEDCEEKRLLTHCTEDEGTSDRDDHALLEEEGGDGDKHHEDDGDCSGSAKRRYPRRSARARSNMFFGLTPFYGVRSYGEEDIPFYSSSGDGPGKRKAGGSRRSAEGQVDGADDRSTSSSGDSGEEEKGGFNQCSNKDPYYYNFTRTIINPGPVMPSIEGIDQCLGRGSQLQRFLKDEAEEEERVVAAVDEGVPTRRLLGHQQIGQLDGVDDSSESDASASTTNTTTTATAASSSHKSTGKRKGRERHAEKLEHDSGKEADNSSGGGGSSGSSSNNSREGRKSQKDNSLPLGGVKSSQGQDPLEAQLSLNTDLLKSDSDNNNSDDCGNILPSDIMEFVLNTPSMQALGQQPEASSSELLSLDEGYGVGVNRRKDILFEDFPQPLASAEHVESGVSTSISVEEPYGLPLELPSDLSVLTTRSPTVNNQNHGGLISEGSERTMLSLAASDETIAAKGGVDKQQSRGAGVSPESQQEGSGGSRESQVREGHMTPEQFEHINSPSLGQVVEAGNQDLTRSSGTPVLPSSPTLPLQGQKYIPAASSVSPGPSHVASTAVQTTSHLKPGPEKLIVVNQHLQPLYVLQTLPNGVTQKIQITPSVSATGVMDTMTLTTGLTSGITTSQPIFPAGGKVPHHPQIHTFTGTTQTGFQPGIPSTTSGLLIGVPSHEPQILVTEAGRRHDLAPNVTIVSSATSISTSSAVLASGHGKKRPISRLQSRKTKKLARSRSQPTLAPSEVRPNMTLINLSSQQMAQSGLVELGTLTTAATTSHRKVPNIIKRPKSGIMYFEPIQQRMPLPSGQPGILGHASSTHLLPCTVSGLNPNQSAVLNMVTMAQASGPGGLITPGSVSLSTPVLSSAEITGPISSLLFKASPHNLGLPEQQMLLQSGAPLMSQLCSPVQTSIASSICVLPSHQTISMSVSQQVDPESAAFQRQQHPPNASGQPVALAPSPVPQDSDKGHLVGVLSQSSSSQSSRTMPISRSSSEQKQELKSSATATSSTGSGKGKQKAKRTRQSPDKASGKKHKGWQAEPPQEAQGDRATSTPGSREPVSPEPLDTGKPRERGTSKSVYSAKSAELPALTSEFPEEKGETTVGSLLVATPDQEGSHRDSSMDSKPKKGLIFEICSDDGFQIRCESIEEAWKSLTDKVQEARSNARLKELSFEGVNGLRMLGVLHDAVVFLLEQLYGSRHCRNYRFRFHKPEEADEPPVNPHGSARAELHHRRSVFDMFNFLASKHRQPPEYNPHEEDEEVQLKSARRATSMDLPVPMRFRHLKRTSKEAVGVYRSAIHGRGLFCKRSIDVGEMVIEYSGNVIRSVLTDKREKYYDGKGVGCYMFRIDDYEVVDATVHGNAARFINHSCEPNCYSRVINVDGQKHIVIFATRKIYRGEELTYDYKFPIEEPGNKLPCNCGTKKCRKFLN